MPKTKPTGAELVQTLIHQHEYDPDFMLGYLLSFVGRVADGETLHSPRQAAREVLESLADFDTFVTDVPAARRSR